MSSPKNPRKQKARGASSGRNASASKSPAADRRRGLPRWGWPGLIRLSRETKVPIGVEKNYPTKCVIRYEQDEARKWKPDKHMKTIDTHLESGGNVGWVPPKNIFVLDCDNQEAVDFVGSRAAKSTPIQARRDHTKHFYFRCDPDKFEPYSRAGIKLEVGQPKKAKIDLKTWGFSDPQKPGGGYAVIPPSQHDKEKSHPYKWQKQLPKDPKKIPLVSSEIYKELIPFLNKDRKAKSPLPKPDRKARSPRAANGEIPRHD